MIINLFSVFDPSSCLGLSLNWASLFLWIIIIPIIKWRVGSRVRKVIYLIITKLKEEIRPLIVFKNKNMIIVFISVFIFVIIINLIGLIPYIFTATSHLVVTLSLTLPLWIGYFIYGWVNDLKWILAHIIPQGTPALLIPFIVVIERVRSLIRPITLSIRLIANIIAGHLLLSLVRSSSQYIVVISVITISFFQILLVILEVAVAAIQSYVLVVLRVLYSSEV